jgi:hypothetical protein
LQACCFGWWWWDWWWMGVEWCCGEAVKGQQSHGGFGTVIRWRPWGCEGRNWQRDWEVGHGFGSVVCLHVLEVHGQRRQWLWWFELGSEAEIGEVRP